MPTVENPTPHTYAITAGELAENYLTINNNPGWKQALKIGSYICTVGILPFIAYKISTYCHQIQEQSVSELKAKACSSLEGALWVSKAIKNFHLNSSQRLEIANTVTEQIGKNYDAFATMRLRENNQNWYQNFELSTENRLFLPIKLADAASEGPLDRNSGYKKIIGDINDYVLDPSERMSVFKSFAYHAAIPQVANSTAAERHEVGMIIAQNERYHGPSALIECFNNYPLTPQERLEMAIAAFKNDPDLMESTALYNAIKLNEFTPDQKMELGRAVLKQYIEESSPRGSSDYRLRELYTIASSKIGLSNFEILRETAKLDWTVFQRSQVLSHLVHLKDMPAAQRVEIGKALVANFIEKNKNPDGSPSFNLMQLYQLFDTLTRADRNLNLTKSNIFRRGTLEPIALELYKLNLAPNLIQTVQSLSDVSPPPAARR